MPLFSPFKGRRDLPELSRSAAAACGLSAVAGWISVVGAELSKDVLRLGLIAQSASGHVELIAKTLGLLCGYEGPCRFAFTRRYAVVIVSSLCRYRVRIGIKKAPQSFLYSEGLIIYFAPPAILSGPAV